MLVRDITERREIPHEPGQWMVFRLLSWRALQEARDTRQAIVLQSLKGVADVLTEITKSRPEVEADPVAEFDRGTLLRKGIKEWSYDAALPDSIDDLDEQTAAWAAEEIVGLHTRTEQERLNGFFRTGEVPSGAR